jgi:ATP-dependent DNA helicase RecQ
MATAHTSISQSVSVGSSEFGVETDANTLRLMGLETHFFHRGVNGYHPMAAQAQDEGVATSKLQAVLQEYWGYDSFRPLQQEAMVCGISGRDSIVILPTGGGKSLCFQVPAVCHPGLTIVVSPLISLMKDQVDTLRECGIAAAQLNSSLSNEEKRAIVAQIERRELKLLYVAPERLAVERTIAFLQSANVSMIAIDEAHCISAWGHDFRPEYRMLGSLKDYFPGVGIHAYTATASGKVREDIAQQLRLDSPEMLIGNFDRPNLTYRVLPADKRFNQVVERIQNHSGESGIVYCISRKEVEKYANGFNGLGIRALPYHAGLSDQERKSNQEAFLQDRCDVIVATVAFGMGIDKPDVRYVVHAAAPKSLEHYQQESGRAGRDGLEAECTLFYSQGDFITWSKIIEGGNPESIAGQKRSLESIRDYCTSTSCRHRKLVNFFGQELEYDNCGACDVCLDEVELVDDPTRTGQMILSCVVRLRERYGVDYTAKVLIGASEARIEQAGHHQLSTFGLLRNEELSTIKNWIDQLVSQGFLARSTDEYPTLRITELGRLLLKGEAHPRLPKGVVKESRNKKSTRNVSSQSWEGVDRGLFEQLRSVRSRLASERGIPAFAIFADATLRELAARRPTSLATLADIHGIGQRKLTDLGDLFLTEIQTYCTANELSTDLPAMEPVVPTKVAAAISELNPNSIAAFQLFQQGTSIDQACESLHRARSTVIGYLIEYLKHHKVTDASRWVERSEIELIEKAIQATQSTDRLRPLFDYLEGKVSFDSIRLALTCFVIRQSEA